MHKLLIFLFIFSCVSSASADQYKYNIFTGKLDNVGSSSSGGSGNVGIGTSGKLAVYTASSTVGSIGTPTPCSAGQYATGIDATGAATGCTAVTSSQWITNASVGIGTTDHVGIGTTLMGTAGLTVMNGNVGIGTWTPGGLLVVNGNVGIGTTIPSVANLTIVGTASITGNTSLFGTTFTGITGTTNLVGSAGPTFTNTVTAPIITGGSGGTATLTLKGTTSSSATGATGVNFKGGASGNSDYMRIEGSTGNVGIGSFLTNTMSNKLSVVGNIGIGTGLSSAYIQTAAPNGGMIVEGNTGIGTVNPGALVDIGGNLRIAVGGFLVSQQATAPTVANNDCGTTSQGTVASNSSDLLGTVTVGTLAVTSCSTTFNKTHATAPICFCQDDSNVLAVRCTTSTTKMTITSTTSMSGDIVAYWCPTNIP